MNDSPKATHYGVWILNEEKGVKIECYVMDTRAVSYTHLTLPTTSRV